MRWGVFGDVHSNLQALEAVLAALEHDRVERLLCLGDVVGYGAEPAACCALLRERQPLCLLGNHDEAVLGQVDLQWFNDQARLAAEWTRHQLSRADFDWLASLPDLAREQDFLAVHSSLPEPRAWGYVLSPAAAAASLGATFDWLVLFGHTHIAEAYAWQAPEPPERRGLGIDGRLPLLTDRRYLLNPGSVGQPRDRQWQASYAVLDTDARLFTVKRVEYDIGRAADAILWAGLPARLAARLYEGR